MEPYDTRAAWWYSTGPSLYSTGKYRHYHIAATGTTPHTASLVNPICAKRFHRHYRHYRHYNTAGSRRYRGATTVRGKFLFSISNNKKQNGDTTGWNAKRLPSYQSKSSYYSSIRTSKHSIPISNLQRKKKDCGRDSKRLAVYLKYSTLYRDDNQILL